MGPHLTGFDIFASGHSALNGDIADDGQTKGRNCSVALQVESEKKFSTLTIYYRGLSMKADRKTSAIVVSRSFI